MAKKTEYNSTEDDFEFGEIKTEVKDKEPKEEEDKTDIDESGEESKKEEDKDQLKDKDKTEKDKSSEEEDKTEESEDKEGKKEKEEEEELDIFLEKKEEGAGKGRTSLKELAKKFDVDIEKEDDEDEFKTKVSEKIARSRQEFNLDGYSEGAKAVIKHLNENGGDLDSFFLNKQIASMQSVLSLDPETKVRNVRISEVIGEGKTEKEAEEVVNDELKELSTREIKDLATDIDDQAKKLINKEVSKIIGNQEIKVAEQRQKKEQETILSRTNLKSFIEKQDNFLGFELTTEAKKLILRDIDNGTFDKVVTGNPEQIRFASYMYSKYGTKIVKKINSTLAEQGRKSFNDATRKHLDTLHKVDVDGTGTKKSSGHESTDKGSKGGSKPGWKNEDFE
jgi:hypothetical protein